MMLPADSQRAADFAAAARRGQQEGEHILAVVRAAAGITPVPDRTVAPPSRLCPSCGRVWPLGTVPCQQIAIHGRCLHCPPASSEAA
jgi:predicted component of type VI protein secretion system